MDDETWQLVQRHKEAAYQDGHINGVAQTLLACVIALFLYKAFW